MDSEKLIELVRENVVLYDMSHKNYSNVLLKNQLWNKIGAKLNRRGIECKKSWVGLRDTYRRVVKRRRMFRSGQSALRQKVWKFEEHLAFLEPHLQERETKKTSLEYTLMPDDADEMEETFVVPDKPQNATESLETSTLYSRKPKTPKSASGSLMKYLLNEQQQTKNISGMRSFLMSMADTAEKFSELNQHKAKSKIFAIVSEIEFDEMTNVTNSVCSRVKSSPSIGRRKTMGWIKNLRFD